MTQRSAEALAPETLVTPGQAQRLVALVRDRAGISISPEKLDFISSRLRRRLSATGAPDAAAYLEQLDRPGGDAEKIALIEAMTTHTTAFFREDAHFKWLVDKGFPSLIDGGAGAGRPLSIWCAACSTGQEPYTVAMVLEQFGDGRPLRPTYEILASDISRPVLKKAEDGIYSATEIAGIPEAARKRFILRSRRKTPEVYRIAPEVRRRVKFAQINLSTLSQHPMFLVDVVLLRNVLIYFDESEQRQIVGEATRRLRPGGYFLTGHSESVTGWFDTLPAVGSSIYQKR